jgi:energy-coupling factor transporter ATP-binding protein EcfA2
MFLLKKSTVIVGMKGSGKSTLAHFIASLQKYKAIIYDTLHEFPYKNVPYDVYRPEERDNIDEYVAFIEREIKGKNKYNLILTDEANRFAPGSGKRLHRQIVDLNDIQRHKPYEVGTIWICRRPVQLHPDIISLCDNLIMYNLQGLRDISYLNDLRAGMGDAVRELKPYHAIVFSRGELSFLLPTPQDDIWKHKA